MIAAHFKPSDSVLEKIRQATTCYLCKGDLTKYGADRYEICTEICKEAGIENPTNEDLVGAIPAFNYHAQKVIEEHLNKKYDHGCRS